jgi:hypothetical protein
VRKEILCEMRDERRRVIQESIVIVQHSITISISYSIRIELTFVIW